MRLTAPLLALCSGLSLPSCVMFTERGYGEFTKDLDGRNELSVSTYPAGSPEDGFHIPYVFRQAKSADKVYLQVQVRDLKKRFGHNPNIDSIRINSFSYKLGGGAKKHLISGFTTSHWMQGNRIDAPSNPPPIPYLADQGVSFETDITLNGKNHRVHGTMPAESGSWVGPLVFYGEGN